MHFIHYITSRSVTFHSPSDGRVLKGRECTKMHTRSEQTSRYRASPRALQSRDTYKTPMSKVFGSLLRAHCHDAVVDNMSTTLDFHRDNLFELLPLVGKCVHQTWWQSRYRAHNGKLLSQFFIQVDR